MPDNMSIEEQVNFISRSIESFEKKFKEAPQELDYLEKLLDEADEIDPLASYWSVEAENRTYNQRCFWLGIIREKIAYEILSMDPDNIQALYTLFYVYENQEVENFWIMEKLAELDPQHPFSDVVADVYSQCYEQINDIDCLRTAVKFYHLFVNAEEQRIEKYSDTPIASLLGLVIEKSKTIVRVYNERLNFYNLELQAEFKAILTGNKIIQ